MAGGVGERFARADGELLLFPHGHDLLGNWGGEGQRHSGAERSLIPEGDWMLKQFFFGGGRVRMRM